MGCVTHFISYEETGSEASGYQLRTQMQVEPVLDQVFLAPKHCSFYCPEWPLLAIGRFPGQGVPPVAPIASHLLSNIQKTERRELLG